MRNCSWRRLFAAPLILTLTLQPVLAQAQAAAALSAPVVELAPELTVTPEILAKAAELRESGAVFQARFKPGLVKVAKGSAGFVGKWGGEILQLQSLLILMAVLVYQASNERKEFAALSNNTYHAPSNPNASLCSPEGNGRPADTILCSGEFLFGAIAGAGILAGNSVVSGILRWLFRTAKTRVALVTFVSSMASGAFMIAGSTGASFLWSQAVKILPDSKQIEQANGIAGRAVYNFATGQGKAFLASSDGQLFSTILSNCFQRILLDDKLRDQWIYNAYRFGLRGEAFTALGALLAASAGGQLAAAGVVGIAGGVAAGTAVTLSAPVIGFIVGSALGIVAIATLVENGVPQAVTLGIQNFRATVNDQRLDWNRANLKIAFNNFELNDRPISHMHQKNPERWLQVRKDMVRQILKSESQIRSDLTNVQIEKAYELMVELRTLQTKIDLAAKVLHDTNLNKNSYTEIDGKFVSTLEAYKKWCHSPMQRCDQMPGITQMNALRTLKGSVTQAENALPQIAQQLIAPYSFDEKWIAESYKDPNFSYPPDLGEDIWNFKIKTTALRKRLTLILAGANDNIASSFNLTFDNTTPDASGQTERAKFLAISLRELSADYTQGFDEDDTYLSMRMANGLH